MSCYLGMVDEQEDINILLLQVIMNDSGPSC